MWDRMEQPTRTIPISPLLVLAMAGMSVCVGVGDVAVLLHVATTACSYAELFALWVCDIVFLGKCAVIMLPTPRVACAMDMVSRSSVIADWQSGCCGTFPATCRRVASYLVGSRLTFESSFVPFSRYSG